MATALLLVMAWLPVPSAVAGTVTETLLTVALSDGVPPDKYVPPLTVPLPTCKYTERAPGVMVTRYASAGVSTTDIHPQKAIRA
ncbi:MAG: hypothetical protein ABIU07_11540, partial [Ramlibacter sp.]